MPLQLTNLSYDSHGNRGSVVLVDTTGGTGDMVQTSFAMNTTGNETQNQINQMLKTKAKQLLQEAIGLL
jgi:hypothetical protein